jgi:hypothetical protein
VRACPEAADVREEEVEHVGDRQCSFGRDPVAECDPEQCERHRAAEQGEQEPRPAGRAEVGPTGRRRDGQKEARRGRGEDERREDATGEADPESHGQGAQVRLPGLLALTRDAHAEEKEDDRQHRVRGE